MASKPDMTAAAAERKKYEENMQRVEAKRKEAEARKKKNETKAELRKEKEAVENDEPSEKTVPVQAIYGISIAAGILLLLAAVWFLLPESGPSPAANRMMGHQNDPKYYQKLLTDISSSDTAARSTALKKIAGDMASPAVEISDLRKELLRLANDGKVTPDVRVLAIKAIGRCGLAEDVPPLEQLLKKTGRKDEERLIVEACTRAIDELKSPNKYRW